VERHAAAAFKTFPRAALPGRIHAPRRGSMRHARLSCGTCSGVRSPVSIASAFPGLRARMECAKKRADAILPT